MACPLVRYKTLEREGQGLDPGPWLTGFGLDLAGILAGIWTRILSLSSFSNISECKFITVFIALP